jgi:hypothetical protein
MGKPASADFEPDPKRDAKGRFGKGNMANPGGRPVNPDTLLRKKWLDKVVPDAVLEDVADALRGILPKRVTFRELNAAQVAYAAATSDGVWEAASRTWPKTEKHEVSYPDGIPAESQPEADNTPDAIQATVNALSDLGFFEPPADGDSLH